MEYVNLGSSGLHISRLCLGMMSYGRHESRPWAIDERAAGPIVRRAVESGIRFFDTADVYNGGQSEELDYVDLYHRPLPDSPLGHADAHRGDDGSAPRRGQGGQGSL